MKGIPATPRLLPLLFLLTVACNGPSPAPATPAPDPTMAAVSIAAFGGPEVLQVTRVARPSPGHGELLLRVHAAGVNPLDASARAGGVQDLVAASLPYVTGFDVSGVVVEAGAGVTRFSPGDELFALLDLRRGGGYAEYALVREVEAARRPARATHAEAASLPLVALTAWQALFEVADLQPGQTVLIHAGAGGVGTMAVQLARWRGARVIATASARNHGFLRDLGADVVIDYSAQRFEEEASGVDVVLDPIGGDTQRRSLSTLRDGGTLVALMGLTAAARAPERGIRARSMLVRPDSAQLRRIAELVDAGELRPVVSHLLPLEEAPAAHRQSETRSTRGKIVFEVRRD
jgi:NADPH:quinone reductase-like Zn-dependent oxidoreductase